MQFQKKEKRQTTVRFDSHHVRLRTGEVQRKTGSYMYRWTDKLGKRNTIYAATLEDLREQEEQILVDQHDGIKANIKNVTVNEPCFTGHFPEYPVLPGVLIMEAMAQAAAILTFASASEEETLQSADDLYLFAGIDNARFKRPVMPGDRLELFAEMVANKRGIYKYKAVAKVDGLLVAEADLMCAHRKMGEA